METISETKSVTFEDDKKIILKDLTKQEHSAEDILKESRKLLTYILTVCGEDLHSLMKQQKLNPDNPVHLISLSGSFISEVFLKDMQTLRNRIKELEKTSGFKG